MRIITPPSYNLFKAIRSRNCFQFETSIIYNLFIHKPIV